MVSEKQSARGPASVFGKNSGCPQVVVLSGQQWAPGVWQLALFASGSAGFRSRYSYRYIADVFCFLSYFLFDGNFGFSRFQGSYDALFCYFGYLCICRFVCIGSIFLLVF